MAISQKIGIGRREGLKIWGLNRPKARAAAAPHTPITDTQVRASRRMLTIFDQNFTREFIGLKIHKLQGVSHQSTSTGISAIS
jgi:hypothetical protein